ncbi:hypothetical protein L6164_001815 [Bauhinia variegata]|uniref:Uncharacterized protein n=1 Tax=Bauhinia variegata TaxID=167791 RepID=A0ACB9QAR8_BAUVA|nr:hypothetical protein L6164_001815 [Bauhinia variegata]
MSATSPSPASTGAASPPTPSNSSTPPPSITSPPPQASSLPPDNSTSPPSQPNADPEAPPTASTPNPTPATPSAPPPTVPSPPPSQPPLASTPPPSGSSPLLSPTVAPPPPLPQTVSPTSPPPPPPSNTQPSSSPVPPSKPPPPPVVSPESSPPPPPPTNSSVPPPSSQPVPSPPTSSPPPPSSPPQNSPPPASPPPPRNSPPPPASVPPPSDSPPPSVSAPPPKNSPPPPAAVPPRSSSPPPASAPHPNSPPPPAPRPPSSSPPPPRTTPPTPSPPPPVIRLAPPPPSRALEGPSQTPARPSTNGEGSSNSSGIGIGGIVAIAVVAGILAFVFIGFAIWCLRRQRKKPPGNGGYVMPSALASSPESDSSFFKTHSSAPLVQSGSGSETGYNSVYTPSEPGGLGNSRSWFTYEELVKATNGFSSQNLLGEGGFGSVYKGCLPDGREIAVKQLKIGGGQGEREFKAEVEIISRIHHRHLVSLVGYCISDERRLLVYDYVPNNTLYFHLHGQANPVLDWEKRVKIAAGAARGIAYLHEDCNPRIIHRDIKSSNILLDYNFEARVSDFGLAKLALDANTHISTRVIGTFGYVAPEYASSGKLTEKSDVFSFGVVLLELITGRKPVDASQPLGDESLVEWARPLLRHALENEEFDNLTDPRLEKNYVDSEMLRMIEVAAACVRHSSAKRPTMGQVVRAFESLVASDLTNGIRPGQSEVFDSALQSAEIGWFRRMAFGNQDFSTDYFSNTSLNT